MDQLQTDRWAGYERLSWKQICERYPDEWVVLAEMVFEDGDEEGGEIISAVVAGHSRGSKQCLVDTRELLKDVEHAAHYWTGKIRPLRRWW
jgi:hypothetical protein